MHRIVAGVILGFCFVVLSGCLDQETADYPPIGGDHFSDTALVPFRSGPAGGTSLIALELEDSSAASMQLQLVEAGGSLIFATMRWGEDASGPPVVSETGSAQEFVPCFAITTTIRAVGGSSSPANETTGDSQQLSCSSRPAPLVDRPLLYVLVAMAPFSEGAFQLRVLQDEQPAPFRVVNQRILQSPSFAGSYSWWVTSGSPFTQEVHQIAGHMQRAALPAADNGLPVTQVGGIATGDVRGAFAEVTWLNAPTLGVNEMEYEFVGPGFSASEMKIVLSGEWGRLVGSGPVQDFRASILATGGPGPALWRGQMVFVVFPEAPETLWA